MPAPVQLAPAAFAADVEQACHEGQAGKLGLLAEEAQSYPWNADARRIIDAAQALRRSPSVFTHAVLFTGHMIDSPSRAVPRFPPSMESAASRAILRSFQSIRDKNPGSIIAIAGGASGGDILFHEACAQLGIPSLLRLTLPLETFLAVSVAPAGPAWVERFHALTARLGADRVAILGASTELPVWLTLHKRYDVWQRTNLWIVHEALTLAPARTLLALWDGEAGDGPGGTGHLVEAAPAYGIDVAPILDPATLTQQSQR